MKKMTYIYAVLLLHKVKKEINEETLTKVIVATGTKIDESKIKSLIASLENIDIEKELKKSELAPVTTITKEPEEIVIEKKEEKKKSATDGLFDLFN